MDNQHNNLRDEPFSTDPEENLRMENEFLKLKLQAERGAVFPDNTESIPAEVEAAFLKHIELFEAAHEQAKETTVYELIGKPDWKQAGELGPAALEEALTGFLKRMEAKNIFLDVMGEYPPAVLYQFITHEFFWQTVMPVNIPGFMQCFIYEEFHPNHTLDIERTAKEFLDHWFRKEFNEYSIELAPQFITAAGRLFTREEVMARIADCLASYPSFSNRMITSTDSGFEWNAAENKGLGYAEGVISYDATLESGATVHLKGPYKFYMSCEYGVWQIYYFVFPGFAW